VIEALRTPFGSFGVWLAAMIVRELQRRQASGGLTTLCIGGGEAVVVNFERVCPHAGYVQR
jgi:acetyl-CoA acetyltransferase